MSSYLTGNLAKHGGSMNICTRVLGCNNEFVAKYYIKDVVKKCGLLSLDYENMLCKFWLSKYFDTTN